MKELLQRYGYSPDGNCNCDGHQTDKYRKGDYQIRIRIRQNKFKIKKEGFSLTIWESTNKLQETLQNLSSHVAVQA